MREAERPLVLDLVGLRAGMIALVGGKAANLGELMSAGLRVPAGVCVTTEAYRRVTEDAKFAALADELSAIPADEPEALAVLADRMRQAVLGAGMPADVAAAVASAYRGLGTDEPVAVRSSATAEDLPTASFAGQQDTYLNVVGEEALFDAVRHCWASLWTDRAVAYRAANHIDHRAVRLAVVVQRMVDARVAGVMFTADPVTGRRHWTTVDAAPGLGEAVVSGAVNPDHLVVDAATGEVVERRLGDKRVAVRALAEGGTEHVELAEAATDACLADDDLRRLVALGRRVADHFGQPQDVEWALDGAGELWLTQSRPITTLFPLPATNGLGAAGVAGDTEPIRAYFCYSMVWQGIHGPVTPMGLSALRLAASGMARLAGLRVADPYAGPPAFAESACRMFLDITTAVRGAAGRAALPNLLTMVDTTTARIVERLFDDPRFPLDNPSRAGLARRLLRIAMRAGVPLRVVEALVRPDAARRRVARVGARQARRLRVPDGAGARERLAAVERILTLGIPALFPRMVPIPAVGAAALGAAIKLLGDRVTTMRGTPSCAACRTTSPRRWTSNCGSSRSGSGATRPPPGICGSRPPRSDGGLPRRRAAGDGAGRLDAFLDRHGHRAVSEIDVGAARWADDPTHVFGVVTNYLPAGRRDLPRSAVRRRCPRRRRRRAARPPAPRGQSGPCRRGPVRPAAGPRTDGPTRDHQYHTVALLGLARRQIAAVGAELVASGALNDPDDVFYLDLREVARALDTVDAGLRAVVARRRAEFARELQRQHVPRVLLSDGTEPTLPSATSPDGALLGTPASIGTVTAPARVVLDPVGVRLEPGEILVAPSTDPGWTPLFLTAGGVVLETGGVNSHGAVVAREYGIPAVVGIPGITRTVANGQTITVDGAAGSVVVTEG